MSEVVAAKHPGGRIPDQSWCGDGMTPRCTAKGWRCSSHSSGITGAERVDACVQYGVIGCTWDRWCRNCGRDTAGNPRLSFVAYGNDHVSSHAAVGDRSRQPHLSTRRLRIPLVAGRTRKSAVIHCMLRCQRATFDGRRIPGPVTRQRAVPPEPAHVARMCASVSSRVCEEWFGSRLGEGIMGFSKTRSG
jgi:hypothetical protein